MTTQTVAERIRSKLVEAFAPEAIDIVDDSESHRGHMGYREGGETHFNVWLVSEAFRDRSRIDRYRDVHAVLADELSGPVHALQLKLETPQERALRDVATK